MGLRSVFWDNFFMIFTMIGTWYIVAVMSIISIYFFWLRKKKGLILPFIVTILGSGVMTVIVKYLVHRARPGAEIALYVERLPSFPSAHATLTLAFFGFLAYCFWKFRLGLTLKIILSITSLLIILLIGYSRIYLGVHYFTDIIGGYLVALIFLLIGMYISRGKF